MTTTYPATPAQKDFLKDLLKGAQGFYDPAFAARVIERMNEDSLTKPDASAAIEYLIRRRDVKKAAMATDLKVDVSDKLIAAGAPVEAAPVEITEGFWITDSAVDSDGKVIDIDVWKVQPNKAKTGVYARRLVVFPSPTKPGKMKGRFEYMSGAIYGMKKANPRPMTVAEAQHYGKLHGICCRCGASLTVADSVDRMMGPVCHAYLVAHGHALGTTEVKP